MRKNLSLLAHALYLLALLTVTSHSQAEDASHVKRAWPSLSPILSQATKAVISITAIGEVPQIPGAGMNEEDAINQNRGNSIPKSDEKNPLMRKFEAWGSGVIVDSTKGYILTNAHVVQHATQIRVSTYDGRTHKADLIGADPATDIALIRVDAKELTAISMGNSDELEIGDFVVAIGNPFRLNLFGSTQSASFGIISALGRVDLRSEGYDNFIQTDAAVNLGSSGGALINTSGELIGITTALLSPYGIPGNIGVSFAIPINMAKSIMEQLIKYGSIKRGFLGLIVQRLTPELADAFKISEMNGALVTQINAGSPAEFAGLRPGDVIIELNGKPIVDSTQVRNLVGLLRIGSEVTLKYIRDGKPVVVKAKITDAKDHEARIESADPYFYGLTLMNIERKSSEQGLVKGVQVLGKRKGVLADQAGLEVGDIIIEINKTPIESIENIDAYIKNKKPNESMLLRIVRGPGSLYLLLPQK